ncbi:MAG: hypothetical protein GXN93_00080 [Candidatus Diapherotrites archaeon]|nr:hypothetical protein [Candidatus Diapherotrites archaeon]
MVLESPAAVSEFLLERYRRTRAHLGDVFSKPRDYYDHAFPDFLADSVPRIHELATKLREAYPHVPEEDHVLMAYILHVLDRNEPPLALPHTRVVRAPGRFFYEYLRKAGFDLDALLHNPQYKYNGIPVSLLLGRIPDHGLGTHVLKKRFSPPGR